MIPINTVKKSQRSDLVLKLGEHWNCLEMAKHCSFDVQSSLGMVWAFFENLDFRTISTHSDQNGPF